MLDWIIPSVCHIGTITILLLLCGCQHPINNPSIAEALDPQLAAPFMQSKAWGPRPIQGDSIELSRAKSLPKGNALVEANKTYNLAELVDLGLRSNPATRTAWEQARSAAAGLGIAESSWLPALNAKGNYNYAQQASGIFSFRGTTFPPYLELSWALFDVKRPAQIDQATQQLVAANYSFNRTHQKVAYDVQRAFFAYNAALAQVTAAEVRVKQTHKNSESVEAQRVQGIATKPELLLALQDQAKAEYELQSARGKVADAQAELAESLGITPNIEVKTVAITDIPLPHSIEASADQLIDEALSQRPDLSARLAELRAKEAEIRKAEAGYWPKVSLGAKAGTTTFDYNYWSGPGTLQIPNSPYNNIDELNKNYLDYGAGFTFEWNLFEGFATANAVNQATAKREAAQAEFDALQLQIIKEVWKSYADVKTAIRKREYALALLKASEESHAALRESYANGLSTVIELLTAERNLASARFTEIESRTSLLNSLATLVYSAGSTGDDWAGNKIQ